MSEHELLWPPLPCPLPILVRPLRHEALTSFVGRLTGTNHAGREATWSALGRDGYDNFLARLAAMTRIPATTLLYALPELYHNNDLDTGHLARIPVPLPDETINTMRSPCRHCACTHGADPHRTEVWTTHETNVCTRHRLWIGPGADTPAQQPQLDHTPEIIKAQIRHAHLIRRRGRAAAYRAYRLARDAWTRLHQHHGYTRKRDCRLALLIPDADAEHRSADEPYRHAADYPEIVALASILANPSWLPILRTPGKARYVRLATLIRDTVTDEFEPPGPSDFLPDLRRALINIDLRDDTSRPAARLRHRDSI